MTRTRASAKQAGTRYETSLIPLLAGYYPGAERRARNGSKDRGDFNLPGEHRYVLEAKDCARMDLPGWLRQARVEAGNAGVPYGVVVHKRRGKSEPPLQYVTLELGDFLQLVTGTVPLRYGPNRERAVADRG